MSVAPTLERAWHLYRLHRHGAAIEATMEYLAKYPESAEAQCILALCHGKEKRRAASIEAGKAAVGFMPDWSYPHYVLSLTSFWFDDYNLSLRALSEALRINPEDPDYHDLLASIHYEKGMFRTARECAENGLTYDPEHVGCLYRLGACLFEEKRLKEAEDVFRESLRIDPEHAGSQGFLGHIENSRGNFQRALPLLNNALREHPDWQFVQTAWKESLRGNYPIYGAIARCRLSMDRLSSWPYYLLLYLSVTSLILYLLMKAHPLSVLTIIAAMGFGIFAMIVPVVLFAMMLDSILHLMGLYLFFKSNELRQTMSFRRWLLHDWQKLLFVSVIILIPLINWLIRR
jgi:tetratricopeptide (TPR) repeat protein